ncbi:hypothetical protein SB717_36855, partial [Priestia sp. SIMBA_032]
MRHRSEQSDQSAAVDDSPLQTEGLDAVPSEREPPATGPSSRVRIGVGAAVVLLIAAAVVAVLMSAAAQRG